MAEEEVKLFAVKGSAYSCRAQIALKLKRVEYEFIEEDLTNKSPDLLKYNPVHKKVPVLLHNGKAIAESVIILEYIDEAFRGPSILPEDPYDKAMARFWAKFVDDKLIPAGRKAFWGKGEEKEAAIEESRELFKTFENELNGKKFFGGDNIGLVDIVAIFMAFWLGVIQEATGMELVTKEKFPKLCEWIDDIVNCSTVNEFLPSRDHLLDVFRARLGKA